MIVPAREKILAYAILIAMAVLVLIPVLAGSLTAFKPQIIWISSPPVWLFEPTLENFEFVLITRQNWLHLRNSLIISVGSVVIALILGVPAAYGFARFRFRGSRGLMQWLISLRMIPPIVVGLPFYAMFLFLERATNIGLRDTHIGLILTYQTFLLPLVIWMMRGYFVELPAAMEESAMVEGYTRIGALWRVVLPVVWPGIVATALLNFIAWNEFFLALILEQNQYFADGGRYLCRARPCGMGQPLRRELDHHDAGYTRIGALWRVVLPVVWPGIVATALLNFIFAWNEFFLALILAGNKTSTLPMAAGTYVVRARVEWGNLFAVNLIIMTPVIVLTIILRRQLVKGLTFGILE